MCHQHGPSDDYGINFIKNIKSNQENKENEFILCRYYLRCIFLLLNIFNCVSGGQKGHLYLFVMTNYLGARQS